MVAFSNLRGGLILLGIDDHGEVNGVQDPDPAKIEERIQNFSREFCDPPVKFTLRKVELQAKSVIVVEIPEGSAKPYWLKNHGPIIRSGSTDRVMSRIEAQQLFSTAKGPFG
jgi:ATP-dependent DNA helicase RecG